MPRLSPRILAQLQWALVALRARPPPELSRAVSRQGARELRRAAPRECAQLAWGAARLGPPPHEAWWDAFFRRTGQVRGGGRDLPPRRRAWHMAAPARGLLALHRSCWLATPTGHHFPRAAATRPRHPPRFNPQLMPLMGPQELATVANALARLRVKPSDAYLAALLAASEQLLPSFPPEALGMLSAALAHLGGRPPAAWRRAFAPAAAARLGDCSARNLASLAAALARWRDDPGRRWWAAFFGASEAVMLRGGFCAQVRGCCGAWARARGMLWGAEQIFDGRGAAAWEFRP